MFAFVGEGKICLRAILRLASGNLRFARCLSLLLLLSLPCKAMKQNDSAGFCGLISLHEGFLVQERFQVKYVPHNHVLEWNSAKVATETQEYMVLMEQGKGLV